MMLRRTAVRSIAALVGGAIVLLAALPDVVEAQSLRGSRASVDRMYTRVSGHGLAFYRTPAAVRTAAKRGRLVRLSTTSHYRLHNVRAPYVAPATKSFLQRFAAQYHAACGERLVITSAVRAMSVRLANSSAYSVHPTGAAVDLRKPTGACLRWTRRTLLSLERQGRIEATEEYGPPHFHVAVFPTRRRAPATTARLASSSTGRGGAHAAVRRTHVVRSGESLWTIGRRYHVSTRALRSANGLARATIVPGQRLRVPVAR